MESGSPPKSDTSPTHTLPSPFVHRRLRTKSTSERGMQNPLSSGAIVSFCRTKGHGFIHVDGTADDSEPVFVHVSDVEGEYIPLPGDRVTFHLCPVPPKLTKHQAIHVRLVSLCSEKHHRWNEPPSDEERRQATLATSSGGSDNSFVN